MGEFCSKLDSIPYLCQILETRKWGEMSVSCGRLTCVLLVVACSSLRPPLGAVPPFRPQPQLASQLGGGTTVLGE